MSIVRLRQARLGPLHASCGLRYVLCNDTGTEVSGILGFSLLWLLDMKIDYCDGLIGFETT